MSLDGVLADIRACRACEGEFGFTPRPVVRLSNETRLLVCGQAPGRRVHESGLPFDDASGERLRGWMGVDRDTFYGRPAIGVAAMAFCYPGTDANGADLPPPARCAALWRRRLIAALPRVELTLLLGRPAQIWALGARAMGSMDETVRRWRDYLPDFVVMPHPSWRNIGWLRRNPWFEAEVAPYLRARVGAMIGP